MFLLFLLLSVLLRLYRHVLLLLLQLVPSLHGFYSSIQQISYRCKSHHHCLQWIFFACLLIIPVVATVLLLCLHLSRISVHTLRPLLARASPPFPLLHALFHLPDPPLSPFPPRLFHLFPPPFHLPFPDLVPFALDAPVDIEPYLLLLPQQLLIQLLELRLHHRFEGFQLRLSAVMLVFRDQVAV